MGGGIRSLRSEGFVGEVNGSCVEVKSVWKWLLGEFVGVNLVM